MRNCLPFYHCRLFYATLRIGGFFIGSTVLLPLAAQTVPDAGRFLNDVQPPATLPDNATEALPAPAPAFPFSTLPADIRITVSSIRILGAKALPLKRLQSLVADLTGTEHSLAELEQGAQRITRAYRDAGYLLARAYLPAQEIKDGRIDIQVLEGRLERIGLENTSRVDDEWVRRRLQHMPLGAALRAEDVEGDLLRLYDTPGLEVRSTLRPGASVGATDLDIRVRNGRPIDADIALDNAGSRTVGQYRLGGGITVNDPLGLGDAIQVRAITAGDGFNYARLAYQLPVNALGTRLGAAYAQMHYHLGQDFESLNAYGDARVASLFLTHPFIRSRVGNLNGQLSLDHKELDDHIDSSGIVSSKRIGDLTVGMSGDRLDRINGAGLSQASVSLTFGVLHMDAASAALDQAGHATKGHFSKANFQIMRLQRLQDTLNLFAQLSGQLAGNNLDSAEKMALGGVYGVRAYPQGEMPADDAWLLNLELRRAISPQWQALAFFDAAQGWGSHDPIAADGANRATLHGAGIGLKWAGPAGYSLLATAAWRTGSRPASEADKMPRVWLQLAKALQ